MIIYLVVELSIVLSGLIIILGHIGVAGKLLNITFFLIFFAVFLYLIQLVNNDKK